jgi:hypothetical protein
MAIVLLSYQSDLIVEEDKDSYASTALTLELMVEAEVIEEKGTLHISVTFVLFHCIETVLTLTIASITYRYFLLIIKHHCHHRPALQRSEIDHLRLKII